MSKGFFRLAALALLLAVAPAMAKSNKLMQPAASQAQPVPAEGKALLIIMRPSYYGGAIASTVYDAPDGSTTLIGVLGPKDKIAYQVDPGEHRFMVIAENADFMDAHLEAGKTYYAVVRARPGVWKARFSLLPIRATSADQYNLQSADFKEWNAASEFVESTPRADAWFVENRASVEEKKAGYLKKWNAMLPADRAELVLHAEDGVATP